MANIDKMEDYSAINKEKNHIACGKWIDLEINPVKISQSQKTNACGMLGGGHENRRETFRGKGGNQSGIEWEMKD